jgi:1,4-alpha-glucan branching enzyme
VICAQNHDQIGKRPVGDRPPAPVRRLAAACLLFVEPGVKSFDDAFRFGGGGG